MEGNWYLPNRNELASLLDLENFNSALPPGNPFMNFQLSGYWSSTTLATNTFFAWGVDFNDGSVGTGDKANIFSLVTAVRGGL